MSRQSLMSHEFVRNIPDVLSEGFVYVSTEFATAVHLCCCGCGCEVVTPLSPEDWSVVFDGTSVSLHPSIGNGNYACESHYWIRRGHVVWAKDWSRENIEPARDEKWRAHDDYIETMSDVVDDVPRVQSESAWWRRLWRRR